MSAAFSFPDYRASVLLGPIPDELFAELPELYHSLFSTREWFESHETWRPVGACVLDEPRHVLILGDEGSRTLRVYNKTFAMAPADVVRACRAIFRASPQTNRLHFNVGFPPRLLGLPLRELGHTDHYVVPLPATMQEYEASLGKSTRRNLRLYDNRLRRAHPEASSEVYVPDAGQAAALLDRLVAWKIARFSARGRTTYWETRRDEHDALLQLLLTAGGVAQVTLIDDEPAAVTLIFFTGGTATAQEWAHDPRYEPLHLGFISLRDAVRLAIDRGAQRMDLLWGNGDFKERFGGRVTRNASVSVFPRGLARFSSLDEARHVYAVRVRREAGHVYWDLRHRGGRMIRSVRRGVRDAAATAEGEGTA